MAPKIRSTVFLFLSLFSWAAAKADTFGTPRFSGSGCPEGSVSFLSTEDAFTVLYDSYAVSTENGERPFRWCQMRIPITVPQGYSVSVDSIDHRGFASVELRATAYVLSTYTLGNREFGTSSLTRLRGPFEDDFSRHDGSTFRSRHSICGGHTVTLRVSSYAWVVGTRRTRASLQMDSTDGALKISLRLDRCR